MILTVDEVKAHLRIEDDDEDAYLESLIRQGQAVAEDYCRVSFETGTVAQPVRLAVLLFVSHYYENRDISERSVYNAMMTAFHNLLYPYRAVEKMFVATRTSTALRIPGTSGIASKSAIPRARSMKTAIQTPRTLCCAGCGQTQRMPVTSTTAARTS